MKMTRKQQWKLIGSIFWAFLKMGPATFGGGYAMIPLIHREVVSKRNWVNEADINDVFVLAGSIPGALAINSATFIGYRLIGVRGALAAMLGILLPTFLIVLTLGVLFLLVKGHPKVDAAFVGIRTAVIAFIAYAGYKIAKPAILDKTTLFAIVVTVAVLFFFHVHPAAIILCGILFGMILVKVRGLLGLFTRLEVEVKTNRHDEYYMGDGI